MIVFCCENQVFFLHLICATEKQIKQNTVNETSQILNTHILQIFNLTHPSVLMQHSKALAGNYV